MKQAVKNVELELEKVGRKLNSRTEDPLAQGYKPELDMTDQLDPKCANYY